MLQRFAGHVPDFDSAIVAVNGKARMSAIELSINHRPAVHMLEMLESRLLQIRLPGRNNGTRLFVALLDLGIADCIKVIGIDRDPLIRLHRKGLWRRRYKDQRPKFQRR